MSRQLKKYWNDQLEKLTGERDYTSCLDEIKERVREVRQNKRIENQINPTNANPLQIHQTKLFSSDTDQRANNPDSIPPEKYDQAIDDFYSVREILEGREIVKPPDLLHDGWADDIETYLVDSDGKQVKEEKKKKVWVF